MRDIIIFDILIASLEDSPQFAIIIMIGIYDGFSTLSVLTLGMFYCLFGAFAFLFILFRFF